MRRMLLVHSTLMNLGREWFDQLFPKRRKNRDEDRERFATDFANLMSDHAYQVLDAIRDNY